LAFTTERNEVRQILETKWTVTLDPSPRHLRSSRHSFCNRTQHLALSFRPPKSAKPGPNRSLI